MSYDYTGRQFRKREVKAGLDRLQKGTRLNETEQSIRASVVEIPASEIDSFLESLYYMKRIDDRDDLEETIPERKDEDEDGWDEGAEGYDISSDIDGDSSEISPESKSSFYVPEPSRKNVREKLCDLIIEEYGNGEWYIYTPASEIIDSYVFDNAFKNDKKAVWMADIVKKAMNERLIHLQQIGNLLIRKIRGTPELFDAQDLEEALCRLDDFTPEMIGMDSSVGIHKSTISRLRNVTILLPKFGKVSLDRVFEITKKAHHYRIRDIIAKEDQKSPCTQAQIAEQMGISREMVGTILEELGIPTRIGQRREAYKKGEAEWLR